MNPVPITNRVYSDERTLPVRSVPVAAYLQLAGHAVVAIRLDRKENRPLYYFAESARPDYERLNRAIDALKADVERTLGSRR